MSSLTRSLMLQLTAPLISPKSVQQPRVCSGRIVCQKHLIGAMWLFEHQESSGEKRTIIKWSGNLKCFNILYRNRNNVGVCFRCYAGRLSCTTDPSFLIFHCSTQVQKCCNFFLHTATKLFLTHTLMGALNHCVVFLFELLQLLGAFLWLFMAPC